MNKLQEQLIAAHSHVREIDKILDTVAEHINFKDCDKRIIEDYAIINVNLPLVKSVLEDILNIYSIVVTTDITSLGTSFIRYLEDAQFNPAQEDKRIRIEERIKKESESNDDKSDELTPRKPSNEE